MLIAVAAVLAHAASSFAQPGSVTGVVTTAMTGLPVGGAVVKIMDEPPSIAPPGHESRSVTTGADGSFRFDGVEPQQYWVVANSQGYLPAEYGQRSATGTGMPFEVAAGQRVNVRLTIWPTSAISGHVVDADGDGVGRVQVLALRSVYQRGKQVLTIAQTVMTDDRGEYRMFWLAPGSYRVAARLWDPEGPGMAVNIGPPRRFGTNEQGTSPFVSRRAAANGAVVEETDVPIYAPSTSDPQLARAVALGPGDNATDVDIQLVNNRVPARHVRGVYVGTDDPTRPGGLLFVQLLMVPRVQSPFATVAPGSVRSGGTFDISGVAPGSYLLYARDGTSVIPVEVGDADVDNLTLTQTAGIALKGQVSFDHGLAAPTRVNASEFQIQMSREPFLVGAPDGGPRFNPAPSENGAINLNAVAPGDYRISVRPYGIGPDGESMATGRQPSGNLANSYLKSVRLGNADVLAEGLHLLAPTQQSLEIVIGLNGAEVTGTAHENGRDAAPGVTVVAVPDGGNRGRSDLYRRATTDRQGRFSMRGLAPGDYTFYAWADIERGAWESPEYMRAFDGRGRFVRLREGQNDALELDVVTGR